MWKALFDFDVNHTIDGLEIKACIPHLYSVG
jgi:hypothetical protein